MTFPATVGILYATSQNQVKDDMHHFNQLNHEMKERYDTRFRILEDEDVNTNSWITWTQSRERLQALQDLTEDLKYGTDQSIYYAKSAIQFLKDYQQKFEKSFQSDKKETLV